MSKVTNQSEIERAESIKHRYAVKLNITVLVECESESRALAQGEALTVIGSALKRDKYGWGQAKIESAEVHDAKFTEVVLNPIPEPIMEEDEPAE